MLRALVADAFFPPLRAAGAAEEWDALDSASSAVKVNVLLALLTLRPAAVAEMRPILDRVLELGERRCARGLYAHGRLGVVLQLSPTATNGCASLASSCALCCRTRPSPWCWTTN